jgi:predicted NUDIX family phosphoesterase
MPHILTLPRTQAPTLPLQGCWPAQNLDFLQHAQWQDRAQAEHNEAWLQPITYLLLRNAAGHLWCYQRTGGDARLDGRCSCGVGGHVDLADAEPPFDNNTFDSMSRTSDKPYRPISPLNSQATLRRALLRELSEELGASEADLRDLRFQGLIYEGLTAVGRVHLGLLFTAQWRPDLPPQPVAGEALLALSFRPASAIVHNDQFELWSRLAAQSLL